MLLHFLTVLSFPFLIDSCLKPPTKCRCPAIQYIDQNGIANLEYGAYLANRTTTRPRITVTDECQIVADVSELDTQNHYLMVFREGAPPIFAKRLSNDTDKIIQLSDITCVKVETEYVWKYYGGTVNQLSVAVQSNEEWCSCRYNFIIDIKTELKNLTCDKFYVHVGTISGIIRTAQIMLWPEERWPTYFSFSTTDSLVVDDMTCVNGQWYYNNYAAAPTDTLLTSELDLSFYCGCSKIWEQEYEYSLDPEGAFANYTMRDAARSYNEETCSASFKCSNPNDTLVIYNLNYKTLSYPPGTEPSISCASSPLSSSPDSPKFWYIDGVMVNDPRAACYCENTEETSEEKSISANTCPCSFAFLDTNYYENYIGNHPFLENMTSLYSFEGAFTYSSEMWTDNACPELLEFIGDGIIMFDKTTATVFDKSEMSLAQVPVTCSSVTKKWTIEGQEFEQLYAIGYRVRK